MHEMHELALTPSNRTGWRKGKTTLKKTKLHIALSVQSISNRAVWTPSAFDIVCCCASGLFRARPDSIAEIGGWGVQKKKRKQKYVFVGWVVFSRQLNS